MSKRENIGLKYGIFLCCHRLELSRKLPAHYITCAHYCWMSSMNGKIGLAGARGGKHIPWEISLFSGLLSMFDISMAELGPSSSNKLFFDSIRYEGFSLDTIRYDTIYSALGHHGGGQHYVQRQ